MVESEVSPTLRARNSTDERSNGAYVIKGTAIGFNGDQSEKTRSMGEKKEQSTTLRADGPSHVAVAFAQNQIGEVRTGDVANTINTNSNASGRNTPMVFTQNTRDEVRYINGDGQIAGALAAEPGMKQQSYVQLYHAVRRLTPKECERLQGFPDDFTRIPYRGKPASQCPDGPRYKALGNSMAVPVMRWIGERIQQYEDRKV